MSLERDVDFMRELDAAVGQRSHFAANLLFYLIIGFFVSAAWWAHVTRLDEVSKGAGRIIPSSEVKVVQSLEGGLVSEIRVSEGEMVSAGQTLIVIDDTQYRSAHREELSRRYALHAQKARLEAEARGDNPVYPEALLTEAPGLVEGENAAFNARKNELQSVLEVLRRQRNQKEIELSELENRIVQQRVSLELAEEELRLTEPIAARGAVSPVDFLRLRREVNELRSALASAESNIPRLRESLAESDEQVHERRAAFVSRARGELREIMAQLNALDESLVASADRLRRTEITAPVKGVVKQVLVNTVGGVISPGMPLVDIVPHGDTLLVQARFRPSDIAFLHPGQRAKVKITAYDYVVYGYLDGTVEHISADTIVDERQESYYEVRVRTAENVLRGRRGEMPILPGMVAEVDILTGERSVLEYLLKPLLRARESALRER